MVLPRLSVHANEPKMLKQAWFEAGLLYRYSIDQFIQVLRDFSFDSVLVQPLQNTPYENVTIGDEVYHLCDAIDSYADSHADFSKFLIVGWASDHYAPLVEKFRNRGYVYVLDDGGTDFEKTKTTLQVLKTYDVETGLVVYPPSSSFSAVKDLIEEDFVDYLMPCFYPFFKNVDLFNFYSGDIRIFKSWTEGKSRFLPAIQVFSGGTENVSWRFPSCNEVQACYNVVWDLDSFGVTWFLPFTGQSERGESFEGFLDHSEVWEIIRNPKHELPFLLEYSKRIFLMVMAVVIALAVYAVKKFTDWRNTKMIDGSNNGGGEIPF